MTATSDFNIHTCTLSLTYPHINMKRKPPSLRSTAPPITIKTVVVLKLGSTHLEGHHTKTHTHTTTPGPYPSVGQGVCKYLFFFGVGGSWRHSRHGFSIAMESILELTL